MTFPPSNQLNHQQGERETQPGRVYYARRSNPPTFGSTEVPRISTIRAVQPINYNSVKKNEARARDILKTEFTEPALNSKRQSRSDQTHSTFHPQHSQENATEPETYAKTKPNSSEKIIVMTTSHKENLQVTNATQTVATHSDPAEDDQVGIISSDNRYTIADDSLQSAPDQEPTHQRQDLSSSNQETKVHSKSNTNTQGPEKPKKTKPTQHRFLPNILQRTAFVIGKINDCPTTLLIDSGACILSSWNLESKALSRVQANHHFSLQLVLTPVRPKDSSIIFDQSLKLPERATAVYELQEERNTAHPDP